MNNTIERWLVWHSCTIGYVIGLACLLVALAIVASIAWDMHHG